MKRAEKAFGVLSQHNGREDSRDMRFARRDALRQGGVRAVKYVWHPALDTASHPSVPCVRTAETWKPRGRTADTDRMRLDLARHMYGRYRVPVFLENIWLRLPLNRDGTVRENIPFSVWYKAAASGASLYKICAAPLKLLSRRECHFFLISPEWVTPEQAMWRARALGAGGSQSDADVVARSSLVRLSGNSLDTPSQRWIAVVRFIVSEQELRGDELEEALDWMFAMMEENPNWSISGRTAGSVRDASRAWHRMVGRQKEWASHHWDGLPVDNWKVSYGPENKPERREWNMTQLLSGKALAAEGNAMRHCVSSYISRASSGRVGIFSLTVVRGFYAPHRALTVEVAEDFRVVQVCGYANRTATGEELAVIRQWADESGLSCRY